MQLNNTTCERMMLSLRAWCEQWSQNPLAQTSLKCLLWPCIEEPGCKARMACHANTVLYKAFFLNVNKEPLAKSYKLFCM